MRLLRLADISPNTCLQSRFTMRLLLSLRCLCSRVVNMAPRTRAQRKRAREDEAERHLLPQSKTRVYLPRSAWSLRLWWEFASLVPAAHAAYDSKSVPADV